MAEIVSTGFELAKIAIDIANAISEFIQGVREYGDTVRALAEKLKTLSKVLKAINCAADRIKSSRASQDDVTETLKTITDEVTKSKESLDALTIHLGTLGNLNSMRIRQKVIKYWCYEHEGKAFVEKTVQGIEERLKYLNIALNCAHMHLTLDIHSRLPDDTAAKGSNVTIPDTPETPSEGSTSRRSTLSDWSSIASSNSSPKPLYRGSISRQSTVSEKEYTPVRTLSSILVTAIQTRNPTPVREQLATGTEIFDRDTNGHCALHHAVRAGGKRVLRELLESRQFKEYPEGIDTGDWTDATALHYAASEGRIELAVDLIQAKANKDARDKFGRSPLFMAVERNHENVVELLLDRGASAVAKELPPRFKEMQSSIEYHRRKREKEAKKRNAR